MAVLPLFQGVRDSPASCTSLIKQHWTLLLKKPAASLSLLLWFILVPFWFGWAHRCRFYLRQTAWCQKAVKQSVCSNISHCLPDGAGDEQPVDPETNTTIRMWAPTPPPIWPKIICSGRVPSLTLKNRAVSATHRHSRHPPHWLQLPLIHSASKLFSSGM